MKKITKFWNKNLKKKDTLAKEKNIKIGQKMKLMSKKKKKMKLRPQRKKKETLAKNV